MQGCLVLPLSHFNMLLSLVTTQVPLISRATYSVAVLQKAAVVLVIVNLTCFNSLHTEKFPCSSLATWKLPIISTTKFKGQTLQQALGSASGLNCVHNM